MDRSASEERHQDTLGCWAMATQGRQVRTDHHRKQDRTEYSGRRQIAADFVNASVLVRVVPGHPRRAACQSRKTWMPGTRPGMTNGIDFTHGPDPRVGDDLETLRRRR